MTIKPKTFYVSAFEFDFLTSQHARQVDATLYIDAKKERKEITISWKEDRRAEVTESQIDEIVKGWRMPNSNFVTLNDYIKDRIFKGIK